MDLQNNLHLPNKSIRTVNCNDKTLYIVFEKKMYSLPWNKSKFYEGDRVYVSSTEQNLFVSSVINTSNQIEIWNKEN